MQIKQLRVVEEGDAGLGPISKRVRLSEEFRSLSNSSVDGQRQRYLSTSVIIDDITFSRSNKEEPHALLLSYARAGRCLTLTACADFTWRYGREDGDHVS